MPPRIPAFQCLRAQSANPSSVTRSFSSTPCQHASTVAQRKRHRDPWAIAQAKAKKAANLSRQEVLKKERASSLGDPIRGTTTPFVRSFDTALAPEPSPDTPSAHARTDQSPSEDAPGAKTDRDEHLNFYLTKDELTRGIGRSQWLSSPLPSEEPEQSAQGAAANAQRSEDSALDGGIRSLFEGGGTAQSPDWVKGQSMLDDYTTNTTPEERRKKQEQEHENAQEALRRISSLSLGSSKDRLRLNKQRCVDVFGRHNTDLTLPQKPRSLDSTGNEEEKEIRAGPDTGSSEVQIAILTAKIRSLADFLETRGTTDKVNKRNLRLLVHRRAKLLKYLRKKERGGPRWQNLVETLGLTDGTWKGEISL
ncbi:putative 37S ribosomal protein S28, mitochondrial [Pseudocercospora fuligena]|uniref:Putative 37S ribosomal protein S28, mitochondrial n=1 Tax=Pseudocercospora fuligena TaxID=685502 RepID=A0A8H6REM5_9PEZI|nr:putative 37S ribosomal protein S28, mitochondrial [Pseudocercospora fuligena]